MRNYCCWRSEDAYTAINPDVDAIPDYVFRAVHTDVPVRLLFDETYRTVALHELLEEFLKPRSHTLTPVIGESGTGKSHLIRWLKLNLPSSASRQLIFVPKAETNLRDIIRILINELPPQERPQFANALQQAGGAALGKEAQRTAILNNIQLALVNDRGRPGDELEQFLLPGLRATFGDPHVRTVLLDADSGLAAELAAHIYDKPPKYEPAERRREFAEADLPLDIGDLHHAARDTREFLSALISNPEWRGAAAAIVNRNLDWAIAQCLNLSGDKLIALMSGIRRHLKQAKKELVLLIEDFARLQGLDTALLQSLIDQTPELCRLRCAFACTTGFYDTIARTVATRLAFSVDMNVSMTLVGGDQSVTRLVGRYMNALRLGSVRLQEASVSVPPTIANACGDCSFRIECHDAFGSTEDGFGLYPFSSRALEVMSSRLMPSPDSPFNPRQFQKKVLLPIAESQRTIEEGAFPGPDLLQRISGAASTHLRLGPADEQRLSARTSPERKAQYLALYELWDGNGILRDLPKDIESFFGLEALGWGAPTVTTTPQTKTKKGPQPATGDPRLDELQRWYHGSKLSQATAQDLRELIFASLREHIDWDNIGISDSVFSPSGGGEFRPANISFQRQATHPSFGLLNLSIPKNWDDQGERFAAFMALHGLLEVEHLGHWNVKDGLEKLAYLQECLAAWGRDLIDQFKVLDGAESNWNPAAAAFDIRCTAALLSSSATSIQSNVDLVHAALGPITFRAFSSPGLQKFVETISNQSTSLLTRNVIASRTSVTKGGAAGQYMDASVLLEYASAFRARGFRPAAPPEPSTVKGDARRQISQLSKDVANGLAGWLKAEVDQRREWLRLMEGYVHAGRQHTELILAGRELGRIAGHFGQPGTLEFNQALTAFEKIDWAQVRSQMSRLPSEGKEMPHHVALDLSKELTVSSDFVKKYDALIRRTHQEIKGRLDGAGIDPARTAALLADLKADISSIGEELNA